jgi:hypothetical protein
MNWGYDETFWGMVGANPPLQGVCAPSPQPLSPPLSPQMDTFGIYHDFSHENELIIERIRELVMYIEVSTHNIDGYVHILYYTILM